MKYDVSKDETVQLITGKKEAKIDIPVLLIFFNRPEKISAVFEQVKKARPTRLYLYQDGARENRQDDMERVKACREVVSEIDWNCEVHRLYQSINYGCDPSEFIAQKWMFSYEEMGVILEDDDVPAQALFLFFRELLTKYKDDNRVAIICGMNNYDIEEKISDSYFFSKRGSIWGWASWRRFIDLWDAEYSWMDDPVKVNIIKEYCDHGLDFDTYYKGACKHRESRQEHYESIMFAAAALHNMLNIVPKYNMISNIGIDKESTHSAVDLRLVPRRNQKLMYKTTYEIEFPLKHPMEVARNIEFDEKYVVSPVGKCIDMIEIAVRRVIWGKKR